MKSVLISIQPYWVFLIIAEKMGWELAQIKTIEVRKTCPEDEDWNGKAIIYCSKDKRSFARIPEAYQPLMERFLGKVIGEFTCDNFVGYWASHGLHMYCPTGWLKLLTGLKDDEFWAYGQGKDLYGWHISDLKVYNNPKELEDFVLSNVNNIDNMSCGFCKDGKTTYNILKRLSRPPQSWCYVEEE